MEGSSKDGWHFPISTMSYPAATLHGERMGRILGQTARRNTVLPASIEPSSSPAQFLFECDKLLNMGILPQRCFLLRTVWRQWPSWKPAVTVQLLQEDFGASNAGICNDIVTVRDDTLDALSFGGGQRGPSDWRHIAHKAWM